MALMNISFFWGTSWAQRAVQYPEIVGSFNGCAITSFGPDRNADSGDVYPSYKAAGYAGADALAYELIYDSSNGTVSNGDIARYCGPGLQMPGW